MKKVGIVRRILREPDKKYFIWIPVYYSESENRYHRGLPDLLLPYKHYTIKTIIDAVNDDADLDLYDLPSDSSRSRWKKLAYDLLHRRSDLKHSDHSASLLSSLLSVSLCGLIDHVNVDGSIHKVSPG